MPTSPPSYVNNELSQTVKFDLSLLDNFVIASRLRRLKRYIYKNIKRWSTLIKPPHCFEETQLPIVVIGNHMRAVYSFLIFLALLMTDFIDGISRAGAENLPTNTKTATSIESLSSADFFTLNEKKYFNQSSLKPYSIGKRYSLNNDLVVRFEVRAGERAYFDRSDRDRSEATDLMRFPKGQLIWNAYRVKIAGGFSIPKTKMSWFIIGQWHGSDNDKRSPYIAAELQGNDLVFLRRYIADDKPISREMFRVRNIPRSKWLNIVIEHRVSQDGLLNIWLNGTQIVNFEGPVGYWDHDEAGYWKFGIYRNSSNTDAVVEYRDVITTTGNLLERAMERN
jgi:hypothetical protein